MQWVLPTQLLAQSDGIFLPYSSAKNIVIEIKTNREIITERQKEISLLNEKLIVQTETVKIQDTLIKGLESDKILLKDTKDKFQKLYTDSSSELNKCIETKPSKVTWFSVGAIATLIATIAIFFVVK